jgi:metal-responsive CopG/Arc/MetJ family transcriptional regulator
VFKIIITFKVDPFLLEQMDMASQKLRITRSELIRRAVVSYITTLYRDGRLQSITNLEELAEVMGYEQ